MAFQVAGYVVEELVGVGGSGEVWRAVEVATGETVALKRLRVPGPGAADRLRREAALLSAAAGPNVVGVRRVVGPDGDGPGEAVLVMDYAAGGSLAGRLEADGRLTAPQVVTVLAAVGGALAAMHRQGLVHGDVTPANIVFAADGRPLLVDAGVGHVVGTPPGAAAGTAGFADPALAEGAEPSPASDVYGLAVVGMAALGGTAGGPVPDDLPAPTALVEAIRAGSDPDPAARPDARRFAMSVLLSCAAAPVVPNAAARLTPAAVTRPLTPVAREAPQATAGSQLPPRERSLPRTAVLLIAAVVAVVVAVVVGRAWARFGTPAPQGLAAAPTPTTSPTSTAPDWPSLVQRLDDLRDRALIAADPAFLTRVYVPGAAALTADRATVASLRSRGLRVAGLRTTVASAAPRDGSAGAPTLWVTDTRSGYRLVDGEGHVVGSGEARPAMSYPMSLRRTAAGWRVAAVGGE